MRRWAPWGSEPIVIGKRNFRRVLAPLVRSFGGRRLAMLALCGAAMVSGPGLALAQSDQQIRCMQLQQDLVAAQGGGGANRDDLARIDQQIAQADRVFQGTQAAMEDANCFQSFFIFGRGLNRTPQCLKMNDRVEAARRQLNQFQEQRQALSGGGGNRRRQAELQDAMARSGCGGQVRAPQKRGGGLLDFFSGGREDEQQQEELPQTPVYRSIDPNGRYRSVCVRLCDGFFYPISYSTYSSHLAQEADQCQSSCAAPAELYVYRNPGQEIEQAISLNGSAYMDLPVALRFRKEYVQGCSCKQVEYNPTEIEAANKRAEAEAASQPVKGKGKGKVAAKPPAPAAAPAPAPADQAAAPAAPADDQQAPQLNLDLTGSTPPPSTAPEAELEVVPPAQTPPAPPAAAPPAAAVPPPPPAPAASASAQPPASQSTVAKKTAKPAPTPPAQ
jgi:pyruvate/2-oxoglutarate dehydrogenase complex dihydrolipoamide acyltransferase (E2) component